MKSFHKFYGSHSDELGTFGATLTELRRSSVWMQVLVQNILLNCIHVSICAWMCLCFSFIVNCVVCCTRILLFCFWRVFESLYCVLALDASFKLTVSILFSLPMVAPPKMVCNWSRPDLMKLKQIVESHIFWVSYWWSVTDLPFISATP